MKWKDWIKVVEEQMKESGIEDNPEIFYIDTALPRQDQVCVGFDKYLGMTVTN